MTKSTSNNRKLFATLEIGHINIASLQHKLHEIIVFLKDSPKLDVIGITETRLHTLYSETRDRRLKTCQRVKNPCRISRLKIAILNQFHYLGRSWACFIIQNSKEQKNITMSIQLLT